MTFLTSTLTPIKTSAIALTVAVMGVSGIAMADAEVSRETVKDSFTVDQGSQFILENINGKVTVSSWAGNTIEVVAEKAAKSQKALDQTEVQMSQQGNKVFVKTEYHNASKWSESGNYSKVTYQVKLPRGMALTDIDLVNGSLVVNGIDGEIRAELVNGSIKANGLTDNGDLESVNGSVKVSYEQLSSVDKIKLTTVNGSIKLSVPDNLSAEVVADTNHGSIKNDFGLVAEKGFFSGRSLKGTVGSGDARIMLESVNGSISLKAD